MDKIVSWSTAPVTHYTFVKLIKFRVLQLIVVEDKSTQAKELLMHSISLLDSSNSRILKLFAVSLMKFNNKIKTLYNLTRDSQWQLFDESYILAYKFSTTGWTALWQASHLNTKILDRFKKYHSSKYNFCSGLEDSPLSIHLTQEIFDKTLPFEPNYSKEIKEYKHYLAKAIKSCHFESLSYFYKRTKFSSKNSKKYYELYKGADPLFRLLMNPYINFFEVPYLRVVSYYLINYPFINVYWHRHYTELYKERNWNRETASLPVIES
jgi:hypothetical protein